MRRIDDVSEAHDKLFPSPATVRAWDLETSDLKTGAAEMITGLEVTSSSSELAVMEANP